MADRIVKVILRGDVAGLKASMAAAGKSVADAADKMTAADAKSKKFRAGLTTLGDTAGKVGLVATAGLGAVVLASANFDAAMSKVQAAAGGSTKNMQAFRDAAIEAGAKTKYSATEAADGITQLTKAGVSAKDVLHGGLAGALSLAAAGEISVGDAAEYTATALTQFHLKGSQAGHVADLLAAGAGKAQGEVSDMAEALKYAGIPAANLGVSIEETAGTIALFAKNGIIGEQAGTSLRGMLSSLTSPSKIAAKTMKNLGIDVFDAKGKFLGMDGVAQQLHDHLGNLTQQERANALGRIFGNEQLQAANVLYREGAAGVDAWTKKVNDSGYATRQAATQMDNLKGDLEQLKGSLETALIGTGEDAQGPLRGLTQGLTDLVNAYNTLPAGVKDAGLALTGFTALAGGGLWAFTKLVSFASDTREAFTNLGTAFEGANKKMLAMRAGAGALGALTIGLGQLADKSTDTGKALNALANIGGGALMGFSVGGPWGAAIGAGAGALATLASSSHKAGDSFKSTAADTKDFVGTLDQLSGAATQATRSLAAQKLQQDGTFAAAKSLGVATRDLVSATLGQKGAQDRVNAAYRAGKKQLDDMIASGHGGSKAATQLANNLDKVRGEVGYYSDSLQKATNRQHAAGQATMTWTQALKGVPHKVQVELRNLNYDPTHAQIMELKKQYNLTPKQVRTILNAIDHASGVVNHLKSIYAGLPRHLETQIVTNHIDKFERQTQAHAAGGYISGPGTATSDSIPAYLSNGEYVIKAAAVEKYGVDTLNRINSMAFADGGPVYNDNRRYQTMQSQAFAQGGFVRPAPIGAGVEQRLAGVERALLRMATVELGDKTVSRLSEGVGRATGQTINGAAAKAQRRR